jgi:penicillin amidase
MAKGLAFGLSFDLGDINRTLALLNYRGVCNAVGCNGLQLYNDDLWRVAPFESALSIPSPPLFSQPPAPTIPPTETYPSYISDPSFKSLVESYRDQIAGIPILKKALESDSGEVGSNWWVVSGANTDTGYPMLTNDPHLSLGAPATFYENHLSVAGGINVTGVSFAGTPGVVIGCNDTICWGATVNAIDVTDVFNEVLLAQIPGQPTIPTAILFEGSPEALTVVPQTFRMNQVGNAVADDIVTIPPGPPFNLPTATLVVPRRNNGPIVQVTYNPASPTPLTGLSVAYTGWAATHEVECLRRFARAASMQDFKDALQFFDVGSQNWSYADVNGNIAYYTSAELPIRQDLQTQLFPAGLVHPGLIRDGTNTNKHQWLPLVNPQPNQALSTEILPFSEMPQVENPPSGYILNANNDPIGTTLDNTTWNQFRAGFNGVLYLSSGYASGERLGRIQRLFSTALGGLDTLSVQESIAIQANNQLLDAEILSPHLLTAYANAIAPGADPALQAIAADPRVAEAIGRLSTWDFSTPTGITEGFDPFDTAMATPGAPEISASVAATIYAVWRGQMVQRVIDGTLATLPGLSAYAPGADQAMSALRKLLDDYPTNGGVGASLVNFFRVPGVANPFVARDIILLQTLQNGLNLLASNTFATAYGNSTNLNDYRWGKLHRIVFSHTLGGPFNIPPSGAPAPTNPLGAALPGFPRAGGRGAVDASSHDARADGLNEFMFSSGPARRLVASMNPGCPSVLEVIPGGEDGAPGSPYGRDQLALWLVNVNKPLPVCLADVLANAVETAPVVCGTVPFAVPCDDGNPCTDDTCNPATGCVYTNNNANACDDGNACTQTDSCSLGTCIGGNAVVCSALDQCHDAGVCDPGTGVCSDPQKANGTVCDDGSLCTTGDTCQSGTCTPADSGLIHPKPKSSGYYRKLCEKRAKGHLPYQGDQLTDADAVCVGQITQTFAGISTIDDICNVIYVDEPAGPHGDGFDSKECNKGEDELIATALNICRGRVCMEQGLDSHCQGNNFTTVSQSFADADAILADPGRNKDTCKDAKCELQEINNGHALEMNSLLLALENNKIRLNWSTPILDDGSGRPDHYEIWRRPMGSNDEFVKIGTTTGTTYLDTTAGTALWEYDLTAAIPGN